MKKYLFFFGAALAFLGSCGGGNKSSGRFPKDFDKMSDVERVEYMMQNVSTDSLARFVIDGVLGRNPGAPIDSLSIALPYIYDHLKGDELEAFSTEYSNYVESLPLNDKMKIYMQDLTEDPMQVGYKLGLQYLGSIRENNKSAKQVEKELESFREACDTDTATYRRFIIGFHTVMAVDSGKGISKEVYEKFKDYGLEESEALMNKAKKKK